MADLLKSRGFELISIIDPHTSISPEASIGKGVLAMHGVYIGHGALIGEGVVCQPNAIIGHHAHVDEFANLSYGSIVSAYARLGALSRLSLGAKVINRISVGSESMIGASALVTRDVGDKCLAYGVPARTVRDISLATYDPNAGCENDES
jgi:hypothetical protein